MGAGRVMVVAMLLSVTSGCTAGVPPRITVPTKQANPESYTANPTFPDGRGYYDDELYRNLAWACADGMNVERANIKTANTVTIAGGVVTLVSGFVSVIVAAQTAKSRADAADLSWYERPETYTAGFTLLGGLTATTSPFLLGTAEAARRYQKKLAHWEATAKAINAVELASGLSDPKLPRLRVLARAYIFDALHKCHEIDPPPAASLPGELQAVLDAADVHAVAATAPAAPPDAAPIGPAPPPAPVASPPPPPGTRDDR